MSCYYSLKKKKVSNVAHGPVVGPIHTSPHRVLEKMDWGGGGQQRSIDLLFSMMPLRSYGPT